MVVKWTEKPSIENALKQHLLFSCFSMKWGRRTVLYCSTFPLSIASNNNGKQSQLWKVSEIQDLTIERSKTLMRRDTPAVANNSSSRSNSMLQLPWSIQNKFSSLAYIQRMSTKLILELIYLQEKYQDSQTKLPNPERKKIHCFVLDTLYFSESEIRHSWEKKERNSEHPGYSLTMVTSLCFLWV